MIERRTSRAAAPSGWAGLVNQMMVSATNYRLAMITDLVAALAFFAVGVHLFDGPRSLAAALLVFGFLACGLLEYVVHRWVLHGPSSVVRRGHAHHHAQPAALISTPLFVIVTVSLIAWELLRLVCPPGPAALLVFGLYAGYNYFALLHHWEHHHHPDVGLAYWRRLERLHHVHHRRQHVNFGISTSLWDRVFGTFEPDGEGLDRAVLERDRRV